MSSVVFDQCVASEVLIQMRALSDILANEAFSMVVSFISVAAKATLAVA